MSEAQLYTLTLPRVDALDSAASAQEREQLLLQYGATGLIDRVNWPEASAARPLAAFVAAYSSTGLYINYIVRGRGLRAQNTADLSAVASDSCVEFFVEPHGDGRYWNFEFNCIGALNASHRVERDKPTRLQPAELEQVKRWPSLGTAAIPSADGLHSWQLMVFIPFALLGMNGIPAHSIRANFNKCGSSTVEPHFLSWSPILTPKPDFHRVEYFGTLTFANANRT